MTDEENLTDNKSTFISTKKIKLHLQLPQKGIDKLCLFPQRLRQPNGL